MRCTLVAWNIHMQNENLLPTFSCMESCRYVSCDKLLTMSTVVNMIRPVPDLEMVPSNLYKNCDLIFGHAKHSACLEGI